MKKTKGFSSPKIFQNVWFRLGVIGGLCLTILIINYYTAPHLSDAEYGALGGLSFGGGLALFSIPALYFIYGVAPKKGWIFSGFLRILFIILTIASFLFSYLAVALEAVFHATEVFVEVEPHVAFVHGYFFGGAPTMPVCFFLFSFEVDTEEEDLSIMGPISWAIAVIGIPLLCGLMGLLINAMGLYIIGTLLSLILLLGPGALFVKVVVLDVLFKKDDTAATTPTYNYSPSDSSDKELANQIADRLKGMMCGKVSVERAWVTPIGPKRFKITADLEVIYGTVYKADASNVLRSEKELINDMHHAVRMLGADADITISRSYNFDEDY